MRAARVPNLMGISSLASPKLDGCPTRKTAAADGPEEEWYRTVHAPHYGGHHQILRPEARDEGEQSDKGELQPFQHW